MLFVLRTLQRGQRVVERFIEASSFERAMLVGQAWCEDHGDHKLVGVERAIVADESILTPEQTRKPERIGA